jgi:hypothetical protein
VPISQCQVCDTDFYVKPSHQKLGWGKYCSKKCRSEAQLTGKTVTCSTCEKCTYKTQAQLKRSKSGKYFCTKSCKIIWRNKQFVAEKHPNWNGGTEIYRKLLINSGRQRTCTHCKCNDIRVLAAHHIDHNRKNNTLENLIWLCLNCHHLAHHDQEFETKLKEKLLTMVPVAQ